MDRRQGKLSRPEVVESDDDNDDNNDDDDEIDATDDHALALSLHQKELARSARPTRRAAARPKPASKKRKKAETGGEKKRTNSAFNRPLVLSPALSQILDGAERVSQLLLRTVRN